MKMSSHLFLTILFGLISSYTYAAPPVLKHKVINVRTGDNLNLRAEPNGKIIGGIPYNAQDVVVQLCNAWCLVDYQGQTGYVAAKFLELQPLKASYPNNVNAAMTALEISGGVENLPTHYSLHINFDRAEDPSSARATIIQSGIVDDSVDAMRHELTLIKKSSGWIVTNYNRTQRCARGTKNQKNNFHVLLCP